MDTLYGWKCDLLFLHLLAAQSYRLKCFTVMELISNQCSYYLNKPHTPSIFSPLTQLGLHSASLSKERLCVCARPRAAVWAKFRTWPLNKLNPGSFSTFANPPASQTEKKKERKTQHLYSSHRLNKRELQLWKSFPYHYVAQWCVRAPPIKSRGTGFWSKFQSWPCWTSGHTPGRKWTSVPLCHTISHHIIGSRWVWHQSLFKNVNII